MPALQPGLSPHAHGNAERLPPYDDESDYMAQMRSFLVPELESPEASDLFSVPTSGVDRMQLGTSSVFATGAVFASAAVSVVGANSAAHTRDQTESEADKGPTLSPCNKIEADDGSNENECKTLHSAFGVDMSEDRSCVPQEPGTGAGASSQERKSHDVLSVKRESRIFRPLHNQTESMDESAVETVGESHSAVVTADLDHLLDMSMADSISSPLLTPVTHSSRAGARGQNLRKFRCDDKTISPTLAQNEPACPDRVTQSSPSNSEIVVDAKPCSAIAHATPIASVQTIGSKKVIDEACHPHSRIPSSTRRSQPKPADTRPASSCTKADFSFSEHAVQESVTPKGFGTHYMWDMGEVASEVPQLQLSQAVVTHHPFQELGNLPDAHAMPDDGLVTVRAASDLPDGLAICSLTPVAPAGSMVSSPAPAMQERCREQHEAQASKPTLRPPKCSASMQRAKTATRIPSLKSKRSQVSVEEFDDPLTPAILPMEPQSSDEASKRHVKLILGSEEPAYLSNPRPSAAPASLQGLGGTTDESIVGTPPFNKLMKFLNKPQPAPLCDPTSALAQADSIHDDEISPVLLPNEFATSSQLPLGSVAQNPMKQLVANIQANHYRSPFVNLGAHTAAVPVESSGTDDSVQPEEGSTLTPHSEMGENDVEQTALESAANAQADSACVTDAVQTVTDDVCCSRVSAISLEDGECSERLVDLVDSGQTSTQAADIGPRNICCRKPSKFGLLSSPKPVDAVAVWVSEQEDGTCAVRLHLGVCNETAESTDDCGVKAMMFMKQEGALAASSTSVKSLGPYRQDMAVDACDDVAVSCTVNIGGLSPCQQDDAVEVTPISVAAGAQDGTGNASAGAGGSPTHSLLISGDHDVFSPPQLCPSPHPSVIPEISIDTTQQAGLHSPIKSLSPDHAALAHDATGLQSPVLEHIELMKELLRSGQLPKPSKDHAPHRTGLPEMLDTPNCSQMVTCIHGSFKESAVAPSGTPGSGSFPRFLEAKGIRSQFEPGGTPYCVMGELWRTNREVNHEFQGFKTMELENAAKMEELHADHIRKLQDEAAENLSRAHEAEQRVHLLAEELDYVRQELDTARQQLLLLKSTKSSTMNAVTSESQRQVSDSGAEDAVVQGLMAAWEPASAEARIQDVEDDIKSLEELIGRVCRRSCTQNNSHADFQQIFSYFHQLKVRLQSGRSHMTQHADSSIENVKAFVTWAKPSIAELCARYDTTAKEVTRRSVDIARMRKMGNFVDGSMVKNQTENRDLHQHLEGVSVSMRLHVVEVFSQLHKIGQALMMAMQSSQKSHSVVEGADNGSSAVCLNKAHEASEEEQSPRNREFTEPLSLMLGRRAKEIQGQLASMSQPSSVQCLQPLMQHEDTDLNFQGCDLPPVTIGTPISEGAPMEIKDYCLTSPPQNLTLPGSPSDRCIPLSILPVLDKQNPLFNSSPEVAETSLSDAPTSFAPDGSVELPSSVSESPEGLPFAGDAQNCCVGHPGSERDENPPHRQTQKGQAKAIVQYPSKDRIEFICHALNMGISPFARRNRVDNAK